MSHYRTDVSLEIAHEFPMQILSRSFTSSEILKRPETAFSVKSKPSSNLAKAKVIYGRSPSRGTQFTSSKSTIRLNATFATNSRMTTAMRRKSDKSETPLPKTSKVVSLRYLEEMRRRTATCKSDYLELQRDIATYEYQFLTTTAVLPTLHDTSEFAPMVAQKSEEAQRDMTRLIEYLNSEIETLSKIEHKYAPCASSTSLFKPSNFQLRAHSENKAMRVIFKGAREVSGQCCILQVHSNGWLTAFKIHALLTSGIEVKLKLHSAVAGVGSDLSESELKKRIDSTILKRLFLAGEKQTLFLKYSPRHGTEFIEFPVLVRKLGYVPVQIAVAEARIVIPGLEDIPVTPPIDLKATIKHVSAHLRFDSAKATLFWSDAKTCFSAKEAESHLMDSEYITEKLGSNLHGTSFITECEIGSQKFSIELHTRAGVEKLTIGAGETLIELTDVELIRGLQFIHMRDSWNTVLRSLELQLAIKKIFPEMFT